MARVVVLGAGLSGLATAYALEQQGEEVTLFEKEAEAGGVIRTLKTEGFLFEQGPRSLRGDEKVLSFLRTLGLENEILFPSQAAKQRFIWEDGALHPLPTKLYQVPFYRSTRGWWKALGKAYNGALSEDENAYDFFSRTLGKEWTERLVDPFISGIYAGNIHTISLKAAFPSLAEKSLISAAFCSKPLIPFSFKQGMATLPHKIWESLKGEKHLNCPIEKLEGTSVILRSGKREHFDRVISTLPAPALAKLFPADSPLALALKELPFAPIAVVNMGFSKPLPLEGFGYLIPSKERASVLGAVWDSSVFPSQDKEGRGRLSYMLGGAHHPQLFSYSDEALIERSLSALKEHLSIQETPIHIQVDKSWLPQFNVGYPDWKKKIKSLLPPTLTLDGSYWKGVSIYSCLEAVLRED